jgi:hypothetical protein
MPLPEIAQSYSTFFVRVPPDVISIQFCTPKVGAPKSNVLTSWFPVTDHKSGHDYSLSRNNIFSSNLHTPVRCFRVPPGVHVLQAEDQWTTWSNCTCLFNVIMRVWINCQVFVCTDKWLMKQTKQTPWPESASELYRPSDRRLTDETNKTNSVAWVGKRTIPTERPPLVGEVSANFFG